jgi:hypothetical protein
MKTCARPQCGRVLDPTQQRRNVYCSRSCFGLHRQTGCVDPRFRNNEPSAAIAARKAAYAVRVKTQVLAAVASCGYQGAETFTLEQLFRIAAIVRATGYHRGYAACRQRFVNGRAA